MRPVELQPAIFQAPNVERIGQQQVANPQTAQQAFAAEMQRRASERPVQVQEPEAKQGAQPGEIRPEERGERRTRKFSRRRAVASARSAPAGTEAAVAETTTPGSRINVVI